MTTPSAIEHLIEKMVRATDEAMKPVDSAIAVASIHGHRLPDGTPPMYAAMQAALAAISASGTHAVVPVEPTEEMLNAIPSGGVVHFPARHRPYTDTEQAAMTYWKLMLAAAAKVGE